MIYYKIPIPVDDDKDKVVSGVIWKRRRSDVVGEDSEKRRNEIHAGKALDGRL